MQYLKETTFHKHQANNIHLCKEGTLTSIVVGSLY